MKIFRFMKTDTKLIFFVSALQAIEFRKLNESFADTRIAAVSIADDIGIETLKEYHIKPSESQAFIGEEVFVDDALDTRFATPPFNHTRKAFRHVVGMAKSIIPVDYKRDEQ